MNQTPKVYALIQIRNKDEAGTVKNVNALYWYQIFALDSAVVEVQEMFSSHGAI